MKLLWAVFLPTIYFSHAFSKVPKRFEIGNICSNHLERLRKGCKSLQLYSSRIPRSPPVGTMTSRRQDGGLSVTKMIIVANVVVYLLTKGIPGFQWLGSFTRGNPRLLNKLMKIDYAITRGERYRFFTACFCHGSPMHLLLNCMSLSSMGPEMEKLFGKGRFAAIYMGSGVLASMATYLMKTSPYSLGASGCIFGLVGAMGIFYFSNKGIESIKRTLVINLIYGFSSAGIDNSAHITGFISGGLLGFLVGPRLFFTGYKGGRSRFVDRPLLPVARLFREWMGEGSAPEEGTRPPELPPYRNPGTAPKRPM
eukprot:gene3435-6817_t